MLRRRALRIFVIITLGGGLATALILAWRLYFLSSYSVRLTPGADIAISRRAATDETPPTAAQKQSYTVSAEMPRYLRIEALAIDARILPLGKDHEGRIAAPDGIWDTGWYSASSRPGEAGVSFIDGHISGPALPAVFKDLHALRSGDKVVVERGDGALLRYRVVTVRTQQVEEIDMASLLSTAVDGKPTLVLMTCGGNFDRTAYAYDQRVVVISTLL